MKKSIHTASRASGVSVGKLAALLLILAAAGLTAQAQTVGTWTGGAGTVDLGTAGNWSSGSVPGTVGGDTALWDGTVTGALSLTYSATFGGANPGIYLHEAGTQTSALSLSTATSAIRLQGIAIDAGAGAFTLSSTGSAQLILGANGSNNNQPVFTNNSSNVATIGGASTTILTSSAAETLTVNGSGNWMFNASITSNGTGVLNVVKSGTGTMTMNSSATNGTWTGNLALNGGVVSAVHSGTLGLETFTFGGGTLQYAGPTTDISARIVNSTGAISIDTKTGSITFATALANSNTGGLTKLGAGGTLTLNQIEAYSGLTTIDGGTSGSTTHSTLALSGAGDISSSSGVAVGPGTAAIDDYFDISGITASGTTIGDLSGGGNVALGAKSLTLGSANSSSFTGVIQDTSAINNTATGGSLTKRGTGTLSLSGASTYTGGTLVSGGKLLVNNTISGSGAGTGNVTVASGAALGGDGSIRPTGSSIVSIQSGGILAPGTTTTDRLTIVAAGGAPTGLVTLADSTVSLSFNLGTSKSSSSLSLTSSFANEFAGLSGNTFNFTDLTAGNLSLGEYTLILTDDTATNPFQGLSAGVLSGFTLNGLGGDTAQLELNQLAGGYAIQLDITALAVPEPATWALLAAGLLALLPLALKRRPCRPAGLL